MADFLVRGNISLNTKNREKQFSCSHNYIASIMTLIKKRGKRGVEEDKIEDYVFKKSSHETAYILFSFSEKVLVKGSQSDISRISFFGTFHLYIKWNIPLFIESKI